MTEGLMPVTFQNLSSRPEHCDWFLQSQCEVEGSAGGNCLAVGQPFAVNFLTDVLYSVANPRIRQ
jgi:hypothetical protein